jgi:hypothetical protein
LLLNDKVSNFITNEEEYYGAKGKNARKKQYELSFQENLQSSLIWIMDDLRLVAFAPSQQFLHGRPKA